MKQGAWDFRDDRERAGRACDRRAVLGLAGATAASFFASARVATALEIRESWFVAEAFRMRSESVARGDQPFGAVIVLAGEIVGFGPSRVVTDRDADAHAERVALRDAQNRRGRSDLAGAVIYSTSRPCPVCEQALALANVERMLFGPSATDAGRPVRR